MASSAIIKKRKVNGEKKIAISEKVWSAIVDG